MRWFKDSDILITLTGAGGIFLHFNYISRYWFKDSDILITLTGAGGMLLHFYYISRCWFKDSYIFITLTCWFQTYGKLHYDEK